MRLNLVVLLCTVGTFAMASPSFSQQKRLDVSYEKASLITILDDLKVKTGCKILLYKESIPENVTVSMTRKNATVEEILDEILVKNGLAYTIKDDVIIVSPSVAKAAQQPRDVTVTGTVRDEGGNPLAGVAVIWKSNTKGTSTDAYGKFSIVVPVGSTLLVSYLGMDSQEIAVTEKSTNLDVRMIASSMQIEKFEVSTGLFVRDKVTYTGNVATYTGAELRSVSSRDVLSSLAILEPSFKIVDNDLTGSNPNSMPRVEIRGAGASSLYTVQDEFTTDPNLPLCILNGIEVPFSRIYDLDPYRIETIHILTDAGSTAIYGSKGANGVLVIETTKAKQGEYQVAYNGRFAVDAPDLTVFNMMNAKEKLEFERLSGKYVYEWHETTQDVSKTNTELQKLYNYYQQQIARGVDTYWLGEPVRTPFSHWHSVRVSGGSEELSVEVSANAGNEKGTMKNNKRDTWGGSADLVFRRGKFIVSNNVDISGYNARESNYGNFSDWVNASPYYTKYNEEGGIDKWLLEYGGLGSSMWHSMSITPTDNDVPNPMWNASLNSKNETEQFNFENNFMVQFRANKFSVNGNLLIRRQQLETTVFKDPDHTDFAKEVQRYRGTYENKAMKMTEYQGRIRASYGDSFNGVHNVNVTMSAYITEARNQSLTINAEGFPSGSKGSPSYALSYEEGSKPKYSYEKRRTVGVMLAGTYNYKERYVFDATVATDGTTTFGSNKVFNPLWSIGLGWNINKEEFARNWNVNLLRITATIGTNGNQNLGQVYSQSVYQYFVESNMFSQGMYLYGFGVPDLPWSTVRKANATLEFRGIDNRLSAKFSAYHYKWDPLIINLPMIPSSGSSSFPTDMGTMTTRGLEFDVAYSLIHRVEERFFLRLGVSGTHLTKEYGGFGDKLENLNSILRESNSMTRYRDGYSPDDMWAVRSYGIDPASGQEIFVKKDGSLTFKYNSNDQVKVGSSRPDLEGALHLNVNYKGFSASIALRYAIGGYKYNSALYDKVENISKASLEYNQDKRALYDRWQEPGDVAKFRSIAILTDDNPVTSRFVQKDNYLRGSAFNLNYEISNSEWLKKNLAVRRMIIGFSMNELFRWETSKYERGINSPYARKFTMNLSLNF